MTLFPEPRMTKLSFFQPMRFFIEEFGDFFQDFGDEIFRRFRRRRRRGRQNGILPLHLRQPGVNVTKHILIQGTRTEGEGSVRLTSSFR